MSTKFNISEVFKTSWKHTIENIWVLVGLLVGMSIISFTINVFSMPAADSYIGSFIATAISVFIAMLFNLGYTKNLFQALDGEEPQFSAYGQQSRKIFTYFIANIIYTILISIGLLFLLLPGIYLAIRLQFFIMFIVEEDAGIIESLKRSWEITKGQGLPLFMLFLAMLAILLIGLIIFFIGIFLALPLIMMMQCYVYRKLNSPLQHLEETY